METPFIRPLCITLQKLTLWLFADWKVIGREHVPLKGPLIIVANHQSNFDPSLLGVSLPRRIWFLAKEGIFRNAVAYWFLRSYGAFPLKRTSTDVRAYRWVLSQLERGEVVVIFPEGTRSKGSMQKAKPGVVQLALKSGAPLLPVGIIGTEKLKNLGRVFNPTGKITVNIGTPYYLPSIEGKLSREVLQSMADMIMIRIAALIPERYHGVYRNGLEGMTAANDPLAPDADTESSPAAETAIASTSLDTGPGRGS